MRETFQFILWLINKVNVIKNYFLDIYFKVKMFFVILLFNIFIFIISRSIKNKWRQSAWFSLNLLMKIHQWLEVEQFKRIRSIHINYKLYNISWLKNKDDFY
jgi:hypothetical protein